MLKKLEDKKEEISEIRFDFVSLTYMKMIMKNSVLGLNLAGMSLESQRLYVTVKLISQSKPNKKAELIDSYRSAIKECEEHYLKSGDEEAFKTALALVGMMEFIEEHVEELDIDGLSKVDWSK